MHLGLKLKILRLSKGITQEELADQVNKTRPLISNIEQKGKVSYQTLRDICKVLGVSADEIMSELSEPRGYYQSLHSQKQNDSITQMQKEIEQLQLLVNSQQEIIYFLKEKLQALEQKTTQLKRK
jgi:transcriptional regulator with XRE-family HTH domain